MNEFYVLSQITITIAGFAALFSILKPRKTTWTELDKLNLIRFYMMIELACFITAYSFLPVILMGYFNEETSFRLSFAGCASILPIYMIFALKRNLRYSGKIAIGGLSSWIIIVIAILMITYMFLGTFDLLGHNFKTNYLVLLFSIFILNLYLFIRLIYFTVRKQ